MILVTSVGIKLNLFAFSLLLQDPCTSTSKHPTPTINPPPSLLGNDGQHL